MVARTGLEPVLSALRGRRVNQLHQRAKDQAETQMMPVYSTASRVFSMAGRGLEGLTPGARDANRLFPFHRIRQGEKGKYSNMSSSLAAQIRQRLLALVGENFNLQLDDAAAEVPPRTELGDLAFPVAFELAKRIKAATGEKKNPREIAAKLAEGLSSIPGVARVEIAGAGYLNVFFDRAQMFTQLVNEQPAADRQPPATDSKLIVEHTSINPNKAAHIGHVRNAVLGDTIVRILKATGDNVEVHNYIDNTGVQVADVVVGFLYVENKSFDEIKAIAEGPDKFDYYCWDLYARVGQWYEEDKARLEFRAKTLHELEEGGNATAEV